MKPLIINYIYNTINNPCFLRIEIRNLEEAELAEVKERERIAKELADERRLSSSFVELLNEHQLFDSFFQGDEDGQILLSIGETAQELAKE